DAWAREIARRMMLLATYDVHETGVVEDNIDGGQIVAGAWFKIAHPMALKHCLNQIAWQPELFAPPGEDHIVRSTSPIKKILFGHKLLRYESVATRGSVSEVLRLSFTPGLIAADNQRLEKRDNLSAPGYTVLPLENGDCLLSVRHDGATLIRIE